MFTPITPSQGNSKKGNSEKRINSSSLRNDAIIFCCYIGKTLRREFEDINFTGNSEKMKTLKKNRISFTGEEFAQCGRGIHQSRGYTPEYRVYAPVNEGAPQCA